MAVENSSPDNKILENNNSNPNENTTKLLLNKNDELSCPNLGDMSFEGMEGENTINYNTNDFTKTDDKNILFDNNNTTNLIVNEILTTNNNCLTEPKMQKTNSGADFSFCNSPCNETFTVKHN